MTPQGAGSANETLRRIYGETDGARIPGGCGACNANQALEPCVEGVWVVHVYHDSWCPEHGHERYRRGYSRRAR